MIVAQEHGTRSPLPGDFVWDLFTAGCASAQFYMKEVNYQHICGQAKGYQKGGVYAFQVKMQFIDDAYINGISITVGSPRKHVWTYAAGLSDDYDDNGNNNCPCAIHPGPLQPAFVGNHYYCKSGNVGFRELDCYYINDPLWDGAGCGTGNGCCAQIGMPWFYRKLSVSIAEDFEVRICKENIHQDEDIAVEQIELFIR